MANPEESSPLLIKQGDGEGNAKHDEKRSATESGHSCGGSAEWTVDGLPLGHGSVVGEPVARARWDSSLFACLGRNDEFCSSDLEVCKFPQFRLIYYIVFFFFLLSFCD
uniref:Uncharacterized protein n=1 Tax=Nelumbo nucifera TaxID=4432 RepID=A0A822XWU9_NELNU|nr:TPA_asm: hypothetical protein HUJ06_027582 [Nelumbo nucifera]